MNITYKEKNCKVFSTTKTIFGMKFSKLLKRLPENTDVSLNFEKNGGLFTLEAVVKFNGKVIKAHGESSELNKTIDVVMPKLKAQIETSGKQNRKIGMKGAYKQALDKEIAEDLKNPTDEDPIM